MIAVRAMIATVVTSGPDMSSPSGLAGHGALPVSPEDHFQVKVGGRLGCRALPRGSAYDTAYFPFAKALTRHLATVEAHVLTHRRGLSEKDPVSESVPFLVVVTRYGRVKEVFLRETSRTNSDGSVVRYLQLVESF